MVFVVGLARAGSGYFVCPATEAVGAAPCCQHCDPPGNDHGVAVDRAPCCARAELPALPSATTAAATTVPDAPLVATLVPPSFRQLVELARPSIDDQKYARTGPPPRDVRASRLMVFLL